MLISKRRLQCGILLLLSGLAILLVRPMRSWVDQAGTKLLVDPRLEVSQIHVHGNSSVIEALDPQWRQDVQDQSLEVEASRAWIAIDPVSLVDRRIVIPHVRIEGARLRLANPTAAPVSHSSVHVWQQTLARRVIQLDWSEISKRVQSLLAATDTYQTWNDRIGHWVARSQEIVGEVRSMDKQRALDGLRSSASARTSETTHPIDAIVRQETNPLRYEQQLRSNLAHVTRLSDEQNVLNSQFHNVQKLLKAECACLQDRFELELNTLVRPDEVTGDLGTDQPDFADAFFIEMADQIWRDYAEYGQVAAAVSECVFQYSPRPSFGRNVPLETHRPTTEPFALSDLLAQGVFAHQRSGSIPFTLLAEWALPATSDDSTTVGCFEFQFSQSKELIAVQIDRSDNRTNNRSIEMLVTEQTSKPVSASDRQIPDDTTASRFAWDQTGEAPIEFTGFSCGAQLDIALRVDSEAAQNYCKHTAPALARVFDTVDSLQFVVTGSWDSPTIEISHLPAGLSEALATAMQEEVRRVNSNIELQVRNRFEAKIADLQTLVAKSADERRKIAQQHQNELLATQRSLQSQLEQIDGTAFARRPGQAKNR